jgi:hypothetical protein
MTKPWKKHRTKPTMKAAKIEEDLAGDFKPPSWAEEEELANYVPARMPEKPNPHAHTRILRGTEIPPICGHIPGGPGYSRWT